MAKQKIRTTAAFIRRTTARKIPPASTLGDRVRAIELGLKLRSLPKRIVRISNLQSVLSRRKVKPNERVPLDNITVDVKPNGTGVLYASGPPGASVTIALSFVGGSNGHIHSDGSNDPNIVGKISPVSFTLPDGYPQNVPTTFTATNFCGLIQGCASFSDGTQQVNSFNVHFDGLIPLPSHPSLHPYTHDLTHPQNTFGVPKLVSALLALGDAYGKVFFGPAYVLWVNDMSLPKGGRFCTHPKGHKWGGEVDISYNLMTDSERQWFDQNADKFFAWHILHGDPLHWHCSINPKSKESSC